MLRRCRYARERAVIGRTRSIWRPDPGILPTPVCIVAIAVKIRPAHSHVGGVAALSCRPVSPQG